MKASGVYSLILAAMIPMHCIAASVNIKVSPSEASIPLGGSTFVDLIGNYEGSDKLLGGAVSLSYRSDLLEVIGVTLRAPSDVAGKTGSVVTSGNSGTVSGIGFASFDGVAGMFRIATVEFRSLGNAGISELTAFDSEDSIYVWVNEAFDTVGITSSPSSITVSPIPEPQTFVLVLAGLAGLAVRGRPDWRSAEEIQQPLLS